MASPGVVRSHRASMRHFAWFGAVPPWEGRMKVMRTRRARLACCVELLAAWTVGPVGAATPTLAAANEPIALAGRVQSASASPISAANVRLAWVHDLGDLKPGDELGLTAVAAGSTNNAGRYQLAVTPTAAMRTAAPGNDGWLTFELAVVTPTGEVTTEWMSRRLGPSGAAWSARNSTGDSAGEVSAVTASDSHVTTVTGDGRPATGVRRPSHRQPSITAAPWSS